MAGGGINCFADPAGLLLDGAGLRGAGRWSTILG